MNSAGSENKSSRHQRVPDISREKVPEKRLITHIKRLFNSSRSRFIRWIGEDVAESCEIPGVRFSSENFVEGVHFKTDIFPPESVGYRCLAGALSDLAASGSQPLFFLFNLSVPPKFSPDYLLGIIRGLKKCSHTYNVPLGGGDVTSSKKNLFISVTVAGRKIHNSFSRRAASPGDVLYLSGPTGLAAGELKILLQKAHVPHKKEWRHFRELLFPSVEFSVAMEMARKHPQRVACTDTSDSLIEAAENIADASRVKIVLEVTLSHIPSKLHKLAEETGSDPINLFLSGGEDYRLLFALPQNLHTDLPNLMRIGRVKRGKGIDIFYRGVRLSPERLIKSVFTHKINF